MLVLLALTCFAAPPDATLDGDEGTLTWTTTESEGTLRMHGHTDSWDLRHTATLELVPVRTVHTDQGGDIVAWEYRADGVDVRVGLSLVKVSGVDLWDAGSLPMRLGHEVAAGNTDLAFQVVDRKGKLRKVSVAKVGDESCGEQPCVHVVVTGKQVAGDYWFAADGGLRRTETRDGAFTTY